MQGRLTRVAFLSGVFLLTFGTVWPAHAERRFQVRPVEPTPPQPTLFKTVGDELERRRVRQEKIEDDKRRADAELNLAREVERMKIERERQATAKVQPQRPSEAASANVPAPRTSHLVSLKLVDDSCQMIGTIFREIGSPSEQKIITGSLNTSMCHIGETKAVCLMRGEKNDDVRSVDLVVDTATESMIFLSPKDGLNFVHIDMNSFHYTWTQLVYTFEKGRTLVKSCGGRVSPLQ